MADNIIRQSQLVTTYGPGAMLDLPDYSVIVSGLQDWASLRREKIEEPRLVAKLRRLLGVPTLELYTPPHHEENATKAAPVGVRVFPTWFIVKDAKPSPRSTQWRRRRLVRWSHLSGGRFRDDDGKRKPVVSVRFVCGCRRGHIDDLNWRAFVHTSGKACERPLWLEERGTSGDITDTFGVCDCGEERSLYEGLGSDTSALGYCDGRRPWIGQYAQEACGEPYRLLVRTASNAYFPQIMSVISLPDFDEGLAAKVSSHSDRLKAADDLGMLADFRRIPELNAAFDDIADESVLAEFRRQASGDEGEEIPVKVAEFAILNKGDAIIGRDHPQSKFHAETLVTDGGPHPKVALLDGIDRLVLVHRLREVVSLLGFTRFEAINPDRDGELDLDVIRASLAETITWLPTVENRGEGVFVSFKVEMVESWLTQPGVLKRGQVIETGWDMWARNRNIRRDGFPGLPYVMLHSLSHMLMSTIALDAGYPASSLRERVYAGDGGYGILIYTGSSDSEGTLGGLVEAGRRLTEHLRRACEEFSLCSNDPVCAEHAPGAFYESRPLQGAACHGCLLTAETSCEQRNDFLDRALVIPTIGTRDAAFINTSSPMP